MHVLAEKAGSAAPGSPPPSTLLAALLHMSLQTDWERNLDEYLRLHPGTTVIDRVDGIRSLQNRATMLLPLQSPGISLEVRLTLLAMSIRTCSGA